MRKPIRKNSIEELATLAALEQDFNLRADALSLQAQYGRLKPKDFKKVLAQFVDKYTTGEANAVWTALVKRCREGDMAAIRLYHDLQKDGGGGAEEVQIIDDI